MRFSLELQKLWRGPSGNQFSIRNSARGESRTRQWYPSDRRRRSHSLEEEDLDRFRNGFIEKGFGLPVQKLVESASKN